jgi:KUP system potassium uptake protein
MENPMFLSRSTALNKLVSLSIPMRTTYFIGRETVLATRKRGISSWRGSIFAWMTRNAGDVTSYFCLPPNGVVELGARVEV